MGHFIMRHGESTANVLGIVVSDPHEGINSHGLTERGRSQAATTPLPDELICPPTHVAPSTDQQIAPSFPGPVVIISSDFARAHETAQILQGRLPGSMLVLDQRLRERNFAPYHGGPTTAYDLVWADDALKRPHPGVETPAQVWARVHEAVLQAKGKYPSSHLVFVAHGDILQILLTGSLGRDVWEHRSISHLGNAEIRPLGTMGLDLAPILRPYHPTDLPHLMDICLKTANNGEDGSHLFSDPWFIGQRYALPYLVFSGGICLVAECAGTPVGYILGVPDSKAFYQWLEAEWFPSLRQRYHLQGPTRSATERMFLEGIHRTAWPRELPTDYPGHLHIDLRPGFTGMGLGTKLMKAWLKILFDQGVPGVHLGYSATNTRAGGFYQAMGFTELKRVGDLVTLGIRNPMAPQGDRPQ